MLPAIGKIQSKITKSAGNSFERVPLFMEKSGKKICQWPVAGTDTEMKLLFVRCGAATVDQSFANERFVFS